MHRDLESLLSIWALLSPLTQTQREKAKDATSKRTGSYLDPMAASQQGFLRQGTIERERAKLQRCSFLDEAAPKQEIAHSSDGNAAERSYNVVA
jgi:hypothetical protein